jgi:Sulfotransferase domain
MIVWLASYPRSGNTFLRMLLNRAFGINTVSLYDDNYDIGAQPDLSRVVGHLSHGMNVNLFYQRASRSDEVFFVKTHELPHDDAKAIYIVRDGRAAIISYYHYNQSFFGTNVSLSDLIIGKRWPGGWSSHVNGWALSGRPNTLVLRYKDLVAENMQYLTHIADFIGLPAPKRTAVDFAELHAQFPKFFRSGSNEKNVAELKGDDLRLFWTLHGETMERMGYSDRIANSA